MAYSPMSDLSIDLLSKVLRGRVSPQSMREAADVREGINADYQAQLQAHAARQQQEAAEHGDQMQFEQAALQRRHAESQLQTRIAWEGERQRRDQSFQLQKIMSKQRIAGTPTGRIQSSRALGAGAGVSGRFTGPRPQAMISGPEGVTTLRDGQIEHDPTGRELVDPATGQLDLTRFTGGQNYVPPQAGFAQAGAPVEQADPLMTYLEARRHEIPANQFEGLAAMLQAGIDITPNQFINQVEDAARIPKLRGRSAKDIEVNIAMIERQRASLDRFKDPEGIISSKYNALLQEERRKLREMNEGTYPQRGSSFTSEPDPQAGGLRITNAIALDFLKRAGGDKERARQLAADAGYAF